MNVIPHSILAVSIFTLFFSILSNNKLNSILNIVNKNSDNIIKEYQSHNEEPYTFFQHIFCTIERFLNFEPPHEEDIGRVNLK
jgi:hypothetical protein